KEDALFLREVIEHVLLHRSQNVRETVGNIRMERVAMLDAHREALELGKLSAEPRMAVVDDVLDDLIERTADPRLEVGVHALLGGDLVENARRVEPLASAGLLEATSATAAVVELVRLKDSRRHGVRCGELAQGGLRVEGHGFLQ